MDPALAAYLARHTPSSEEIAVWWNGQIRLRARGYVADELPPLDLVSSVRAVVFQGDRVLVMRNRDGVHVLPGGRREPGESVEETLRREILEEAGWTIRDPVLLGAVHFHHLTAKPPGYPYRYPDFVHLVYVAEAAEPRSDARIPDDYEVEAGFCPIGEVEAPGLAPVDRLYLATARRRLDR